MPATKTHRERLIRLTGEHTTALVALKSSILAFLLAVGTCLGKGGEGPSSSRVKAIEITQQGQRELTVDKENNRLNIDKRRDPSMPRFQEEDASKAMPSGIAVVRGRVIRGAILSIMAGLLVFYLFGGKM